MMKGACGGAERDEAAVLSLAYFLTPFTVTQR